LQPRDCRHPQRPDAFEMLGCDLMALRQRDTRGVAAAIPTHYDSHKLITASVTVVY
jgi:hypothetical protein